MASWDLARKSRAVQTKMEKRLSVICTHSRSTAFSDLQTSGVFHVLNGALLEAALPDVLLEAAEMIKAHRLNEPVDFPPKTMQP